MISSLNMQMTLFLSLWLKTTYKIYWMFHLGNDKFLKWNSIRRKRIFWVIKEPKCATFITLNNRRLNKVDAFKILRSIINDYSWRYWTILIRAAEVKQAKQKMKSILNNRIPKIFTGIKVLRCYLEPLVVRLWSVDLDNSRIKQADGHQNENFEKDTEDQVDRWSFR